MNNKTARILLVVAATLSVTFAGSLFATNGTHLTAYGARAAGMGGATLAVGGSEMDIQANPSQLARLKKGIFGFGMTAASARLTYEDSLIDWLERDPYLSYTNKTKAEKSIFPIPYIGYAAPLGKNMGWGIAFYGQGGAGASFKGIKRPLVFPGGRPVPFGSFFPGVDMGEAGKSKVITENTFSELSIARLTPGLAVKFGRISVGAALDVSLAMMEFRYTMSDPTGAMEMPGAGFRYQSDKATALSGKFSFTIDLTDNVAFSYAYQGGSKFKMDGEMSVNAGQPIFNIPIAPGQVLPLPNVAPQKTKFTFYEPEEHTVGLAIKMGALTVGIDVGYIKWSNVFRSMDFQFAQPVMQLPFGNFVDTMTFNVLWEDQRVYAIGFEYKPGDTAYRFGYNYGKSPVQGQGLNPIFPAIAEHHISAGLGLKLGSAGLDLAVEYAPKATIKGGPNSEWTVFHAIYGIKDPVKDIKGPGYNYQVSMTQLNLSFGLKWEI